MRALGNYLMRGRLQAVTVIGLGTVISWFVPPLAYPLSGVPLSLVVLRRGAVIGMQVTLGCLVFTVLMALAVQAAPQVAAAFAFGVWVPVWVASIVLRRTESQGLMVTAAGAVGVVFVSVMHLFVADVTEWWRAWMQVWMQGHLPAESAGRYKEMEDTLAPMFNAMMGAALCFSLSLSVLLARAWQARLFNPGAFQREFHNLRLPRGLALAVLAAVIGILLLEGGARALLTDILVVVLFMYLFQGISTVHRTVAARGLSPGWLVGMYVLLLLLPQMILFMSCLGIADSWILAGRRGPDRGGSDN